MTMKEQLDQYYKNEKIEPVSWNNDRMKMFSAFRCCQKGDCYSACLDAFCRAKNKEDGFLFQPHTNEPLTATTTVSDYYQDGNYHGDRIPRIVVLSLSIPQPEPLSVPQPAANPKTYLDPDAHWSRTLVTVRSLLHPFIAPERFPKPVIKEDDKSKKEVEELFVHVRTAKCCSNAGKPPSSQEPPEVYENCGKYLGEELSILKPDVIVTQGNKARDMAKCHAFNAIEQVKGLDLERPIAYIAKLKEDDRRVYWLKMTFPSKRWKRWLRRWCLEAGPAIESESNVDPKRAKREHLVSYGKAIKQFINDR